MKTLVNCGWDDVPHLTEEMKQSMESGMLPHLKEARRNGRPILGSGAIYPIPEEDIVYSGIEMDKYWRVGCGFDVGWKKNAAVWGAYNSANDTIYLTDEYYRGYAEPAVHAQALLARGKKIPTMIDTAAHASGQFDGKVLFTSYQDLGLHLINANKAVDAGLLEVYQRLSSGRLKVHKNLMNWWSEFRIYRRDDKGAIVKKNDHLMDATRYLVMGLANFDVNKDKIRQEMRNEHMCEVDYEPFQ